MSDDPYKERIDGQTFIRSALNAPHERLCDRLHTQVLNHLPANSALQLLPRRSTLTLRPGTEVCPDLSLVRRRDGQLYLAAEVLQPGDHHADTVLKKQIYADCRVPRLWIVDSRYENVEIYAPCELGFRLRDILAGDAPLTEITLPGFSCLMRELFAKSSP